MEIQEALKIMRALADGISPKTGEVLTSELVYQYAPVVRAFHRAVGAIEILEERAFPQNIAGKCRQVLVTRKTRRFVTNCRGGLIFTRSRRTTIARSVRSSRIW